MDDSLKKDKNEISAWRTQPGAEKRALTAIALSGLANSLEFRPPF
jgi:hypothetical protein